MDIFQLDWIAISFFVIFCLLILLISVRFYKHLSRWRSFISNTSIKKYNLNYLKKKSPILERFSSILFMKNMDLNIERNYPLFIIIGDYWSKKFHRILIEALCSKGFNILFLNFFPKLVYKIRTQTHAFNLKNAFSFLMKYLKTANYIKDYSYHFIDYSKDNFYYEGLFNDTNNHTIISINPKITKSYLLKITNRVSEIADHNFNLIFSQYSYLVLKNKYEKRINTKLPQSIREQINIISIRKARYSFRYYETILFGEIIKLVN